MSRPDEIRRFPTLADLEDDVTRSFALMLRRPAQAKARPISPALAKGGDALALAASSSNEGTQRRRSPSVMSDPLEQKYYKA